MDFDYRWPPLLGHSYNLSENRINEDKGYAIAAAAMATLALLFPSESVRIFSATVLADVGGTVIKEKIKERIWKSKYANSKISAEKLSELQVSTCKVSPFIRGCFGTSIFFIPETCSYPAYFNSGLLVAFAAQTQLLGKYNKINFFQVLSLLLIGEIGKVALTHFTAYYAERKKEQESYDCGFGKHYWAIGPNDQAKVHGWIMRLDAAAFYDTLTVCLITAGIALKRKGVI